MLKNILRPLLVGLITGMLTTLILLLLLAFAASVIDIPIAAVLPLATVSNAFGAFICGFTSAKISKRNGWLIGLLSALALFLLTTVAGFGLYNTVDGSFITIKAMIMLACGMVGGIVALNSGKPHHKK